MYPTTTATLKIYTIQSKSTTIGGYVSRYIFFYFHRIWTKHANIAHTKAYLHEWKPSNQMYSMYIFSKKYKINKQILANKRNNHVMHVILMYIYFQCYMKSISVSMAFLESFLNKNQTHRLCEYTYNV